LNLGAQLCDLVFTLLESLALLLALLRQLSDLFLGCKSATIASLVPAVHVCVWPSINDTVPAAALPRRFDVTLREAAVARAVELAAFVVVVAADVVFERALARLELMVEAIEARGAAALDDATVPVVEREVEASEARGADDDDEVPPVLPVAPEGVAIEARLDRAAVVPARTPMIPSAGDGCCIGVAPCAMFSRVVLIADEVVRPLDTAAIAAVRRSTAL